MRKPYLLALILSFQATSAFAQKAAEEAWPVPAVPNMLFYLQRDPDINTVVYTANVDKNGLLNEKDPVNIFWVKYTEGGVHKPLNVLQRDLAYGLSAKPRESGQYELKAVAYPKMPMHLQRGRDNKYHVQVILTNKPCVLRKIFIHIIGGSHLHPDVAFLEFHGTELESGKAVTEKIYPK